MELINDEGKLTDYTICFHNKLKGFKDKVFVRKLCQNYYGEHVTHSLNFRG